jgi:hypothetical protein
MNCRYCDHPILSDISTTFAYWGGFSFPCHKQCKQEGIKHEAYECQLIDADCNDCRHFQRGQVEKRWLSCIENERPSLRLVNMGYIHGHCLKFSRPTIAQPNKWTGMNCFEHRRVTNPSSEAGEK